MKIIKAETALGAFFCKNHNIDPNRMFEVEYVDPNIFLTSERLDLVPKILWIKSKENGLETDFYNELYREHIKAITGRTGKESGQEDIKNSISSFEKVFESIRSVKNEELDYTISAIPVSKNYIIMDGAHRTASSIAYNRAVPIIRIDEDYPDTGASFFNDNLLDTKYLEYMVSEYCKMTSKNVYSICLWPKSNDKLLRQKADALIKDTTKIIYKKEINLNYNGLRNFIVQIYCNYDWLGGIKDNFSGADSKAKNCWDERGSAVFYFVEGPELSIITDLKSRIRDLYKIGNDSIHITDNNIETSQIADIILNENSLDMLRRGTPTKFKKINILIDNFKKAVISNEKELYDYIIDSSGVLALYGLRDANDLDYLGHEALPVKNEEIDIHNDCLIFHSKTLDDLLYNPKNYLFYNGVKFINLECARSFKLNRGEKKDKLDVELINSINSGKVNLKLCFDRFVFEKKREWKFLYRNIKIALKTNPVSAPIYCLVKKIVKGK